MDCHEPCTCSPLGRATARGSTSTPRNCGSCSRPTPTATTTPSRTRARACGARTCGTRRATAHRRRRRCRPQPQLRLQVGPRRRGFVQVGPRRRGFVAEPHQPDPPRAEPRVGARAPGPGRLREAHRVHFDPSACAGKAVEVSPACITDPSGGGRGVLADDVSLVGGGTAAETEGFETSPGTWSVPGPPPGSPAVLQGLGAHRGAVPDVWSGHHGAHGASRLRPGTPRLGGRPDRADRQGTRRARRLTSCSQRQLVPYRLKG